MIVVLATRNAHKVREMQQLFEGTDLELIPLPDSAPDPEETGETFAANALIKARSASAATGRPALADDSGICIDALDGAPGVQSARWTQESDWIPRVLTLLEAVPDARRTARYVCALCLTDADGSILAESEGTFEGRIAYSPRGTQGFGYDPIFLAGPELDRTVGELSPDEKHARSHRGVAARGLRERLG